MPVADSSIIFWFAMVTAIATGIGALPFYFVKHVEDRWMGLANAFAAGLMLAASIVLAYEGYQFGTDRVAFGFFSGIVFIWLSNKFLARFEDLKLGALDGLNARKAILLLLVMTLHSFTEGVGIGVSFGNGPALGWMITAAIAVHNIPEGLAISLVLIPRGVSVHKALLWCVVSSLPQPLMAVPAFMFVQTFTAFLPAGLGFAAGAMTWMVVVELLPEARAKTSNTEVVFTVASSMVLMLAFQYFMSWFF